MYSVIRLLRDCVILTDSSLVITDMNPAATLYLGADHGVGSHLDKILTPRIIDDKTPLNDPGKILEGASERQGVTTLNTAQGARRVRFRVAKLSEKEAGKNGFAIVLEDRGPEGRPSEEKLTALATAIEYAGEAIVVTNADGVIEYVNPAFQQVTGYTKAEAVGQNPRVLKSGVHPASFYEELWNTITSGKVWRGEITNKRKNGTLYIDRASIAPIFDDEGKITHFVAVKQNVTERKKAVADLKKSHQLIEAISRAQSEFIGESSDTKVFEGLLSTLIELTESEYGVIAEIAEGKGEARRLRTRAITNIAWNDETKHLYSNVSEGAGIEFPNMKNLLGVVVTENRPIISNDPTRDPRRGGLPEGHPPLKTYLGLPIRSGGKIIGMAGVANREGGYNESDVRFLEPLIATCATIMEAVWAENYRAAAETAIFETARELKEADALKNKMISIVSHDLRSPFTSNIGLLKLLEDSKAEPLTSRQMKIVQTLSRSLGSQFTLVENLLELSRVYKGGITIEPKRTPAVEILKESADMLRQLASEKNIKIVTKSSKNHWINVDKNRMIQVINNLITNAVKFTKPGGAITLDSVAEDDLVTLIVADNGVGIEPAIIPKLLDLSEHTSTLGTAGERGTGLGLSICDELTLLNGGKLEIDSEKERGTTIRIVFSSYETSRTVRAK